MKKVFAVFMLISFFIWAFAMVASAAPNIRVMRPQPVSGDYDAGPPGDPTPLQGQWFKKISSGVETPLSLEFYDNVEGNGGGDSGSLAIKGYIQNLQYDDGNLISFDIGVTITNDSYFSDTQLWENATNLHEETQEAEYCHKVDMQDVILTIEFADAGITFPGGGSPYVGPVSAIKAANPDYLAWYCWSPGGTHPPGEDGAYMVPAWHIAYYLVHGASAPKTLQFNVDPPAAPGSDLYEKIHSFGPEDDILINRTKSVKVSQYFEPTDSLVEDTGSAYPDTPEQSSNCSVFFTAGTVPCPDGQVPPAYVDPPEWSTNPKYTHQTWLFTEPGWYTDDPGGSTPPCDPPHNTEWRVLDPEPPCYNPPESDCDGPEIPYEPDDLTPATVNPGTPLFIEAKKDATGPFSWVWIPMGGPWYRRGFYGGHADMAHLSLRIPNEKDRCRKKELWIQYIVYWNKDEYGNPQEPQPQPHDGWIEAQITTQASDEVATRISRTADMTCGGGMSGYFWIITELWEIDTQPSCEYITIAWDLGPNFVTLVERVDVDTRCLDTYIGTDADGDGIVCENDNCPNDWNQNQVDTDNDGVGDVCDNCRLTDNPGQQNTNAPDDVYGNKCDCDVDNNGSVDALDYNTFLSDWGSLVSLDTDFNSDGVVDAYDYNILLTRWNQEEPFE